MEAKAQKLLSRVSPHAVVICNPPLVPLTNAKVLPLSLVDDDTFFKLPTEPRKPCKSFCAPVTQQRTRHVGCHPNADLPHSLQQVDENGKTHRRWSLDRSAFPAVPHGLRIHDIVQIKMKTFIASGGFGSVYKGQFRGRVVAVKKMHRCVKNIKAKVESFYAECSAQHLKHANVVQILATSVGDPVTRDAWIVMEYAGDKDLQNVISNPLERLDFRRRLRYAVDIISALRYIHERHVMHLDLKPANVIITPLDHCKLGDFGCCQTVTVDAHSCFPRRPLRRSCPTGTYAYRDPELLRGRAPTTKADIYSFGVVLWQMMSRETPYSGQNQHVVIYRVVAYGIRPRALSPAPNVVLMSYKRRDEVSSDSSAGSGSTSSSAGQDSRHSSSSSTGSETARFNTSPASMEAFYRALYVQCWDAEPDNRQSADDIADLLQSWSEYLI